MTPPDRKAILVIGAGDATGGAIARRFARDARKEDDMVALVQRIEAEVAPIEVAVFNPGANVRFSITETTSRVYFKVWEMACFGGFLMGREGFAAFASAKAALRATAQSMARELWPKGIHVAHVVVDGAIDTAFIRDNFPERYALKDRGGILDPEHIAEAYWQVHQQPRTAWTHETELRPWTEAW